MKKIRTTKDMPKDLGKVVDSLLFRKIMKDVKNLDTPEKLTQRLCQIVCKHYMRMYAPREYQRMRHCFSRIFNRVYKRQKALKEKLYESRNQT